jgi:hypothetical protein
VERLGPDSFEADASQLREVLNLLSIGRESDVVLGALREENPCRNWEIVKHVLPNMCGFIFRHGEENVSKLLGKKDDAEVSFTVGACNFSCELMKQFEQKILDIADESMQVKGSEVCKQILAILEDKKEMTNICSKLALKEELLHISGLYCAPSWPSWELDSDEEVPDDFVSDSGTCVYTVCVRFGAQGPKVLNNGYEPSTSDCTLFCKQFYRAASRPHAFMRAFAGPSAPPAPPPPPRGLQKGSGLWDVLA